MRNLLIRWALWVLKRYDAVPFRTVLPKEWRDSEPYVSAATALVRSHEGIDQSGEFKRHQVYAQLIKKFPDARKRDLGMAIERAVGGCE